MIATITKKLSFDQFLVECPENGCYELVNGEIVQINATRNHDDVADFSADSLFVYLLDAEGNYPRSAFKGSDRIVSQTFPELTITAEQIINA